MITVSCTVNVKMKDDVYQYELREFIKAALLSYGGGLHPDDQWFDNVKGVTVKNFKTRKYTLKIPAGHQQVRGII